MLHTDIITDKDENLTLLSDAMVSRQGHKDHYKCKSPTQSNDLSQDPKAVLLTNNFVTIDNSQVLTEVQFYAPSLQILSVDVHL